jgi:predicted NBD/HSP70 family sugar kinase
MITASIADICGKVLHSQRYNIEYKMIVDQIYIEIAMEAMKYFPSRLTCIGCIAVTPGIGLIDENEKTSKDTKHPYFWKVKKLYEILKNKYHIPLYTDNITNVALLGEKWFGKGRDTDNFALYNIGRGIGSSVCINGKLLRRYQNSCTEIGHTTINFEGPYCDCGNRGCLELYASTVSWEKKLTRMGIYPGEKNKVGAMFLNALRGDAVSKDLLHQFSRMVAEGAIILASMFSPEKIIITTNEAEYIYLSPIIDEIKEAMKTRIFSTQRQEISIEESELRETSYILGGISAVLEKKLFAS